MAHQIMTWNELMERIAWYIWELSTEERKKLEEDLGIKEYETPFGTLRIRIPKLLEK